MTRTARFVLLGLALVAAGGTVWAATLRGSEDVVPDVILPAVASGAVPVRTLSVRSTEAPEFAPPVVATGTLEPDARVSLAFPVEGVVAGYDAREGEVVTGGQVLARLDAVPYRAALEQAEARVRYLVSRWNRTVGLHDRGLVSDEKLDADRADLEAARAEATLAAWRVERTELHAPFAGRILHRDIEPGQVVSTDTQAFVLLAVDTLEVEVGVPAKDVSILAAKSPVMVRVEDLGGTFPGYVDHAPVSGDPRAGSVTVTVKVPNRAHALLPGLVAVCTFTPSDPAPAGGPEIRIPVSAVRATPSGPVALVVKDGVATEAPLVTGEIRGDQVVVTRGLVEGDVLIHEAPDRLRPGDRVVEAG